jgi:hypothetical protein
MEGAMAEPVYPEPTLQVIYHVHHAQIEACQHGQTLWLQIDMGDGRSRVAAYFPNPAAARRLITDLAEAIASHEALLARIEGRP